jgi:hypothetical protein
VLILTLAQHRALHAIVKDLARHAGVVLESLDVHS